MVQTIADILNKKSWTGDDVGRALIASTIDFYQQALAGKGTPEPLFSAERLQQMVASLRDPAQLLRYNRYVGLNNWLSQYQAVANAYMQMIDGKLQLFYYSVCTAHAVEEGYACLANQPPMMIDPLFAINAICGLEQYTVRNPKYAERTAELQEARATLDESIRYVVGYNRAVELIAEHIEMPDFLLFRMNLDLMLSRVSGINRVSDLLRQRLAEAPYQDATLQDLKLAAINNLFAPLPTQAPVVSEAAVEAAIALLQDNLSAFERQDGCFIDLLTEWR